MEGKGDDSKILFLSPINVSFTFMFLALAPQSHLQTQAEKMFITNKLMVAEMGRK